MLPRSSNKFVAACFFISVLQKLGSHPPPTHPPLLLDLSSPVKTETSRCPQFTFLPSVLPTGVDTFTEHFQQLPLLTLRFPHPPTSLHPPPHSTLPSVGRCRGPKRVCSGPPPECEGEKVPQTELLIQSAERYAQLGIHKGPGWLRGPRGGQEARSPWGINCRWQCVNSGVNRRRRCGTPRSRLNGPFHALCCHRLSPC